MIIKPGQLVESIFQIEISGVLTNVDPLTTPIVQVYRNQLLTSLIPTITNPKTGVYQFSFEVPTNWLDYDQISVWIESEISGFVAKTFKPIGTVLNIEKEKLDEVWKLLGLDATNPVTHTTTQISIGSTAQIDLSIDEQNNTVVSQRV